jgi:hypothetical protein
MRDLLGRFFNRLFQPSLKYAKSGWRPYPPRGYENPFDGAAWREVMPDRWDLAWVAEVRACGVRKANLYLQNGYKLIGLGQSVYERDRRVRPDHPPGSETFIGRNYQFLLGRPHDVAPYEPEEVVPQEAGGSHEGTQP